MIKLDVSLVLNIEFEDPIKNDVISIFLLLSR